MGDFASPVLIDTGKRKKDRLGRIVISTTIPNTLMNDSKRFSLTVFNPVAVPEYRVIRQCLTGIGHPQGCKDIHHLHERQLLAWFEGEHFQIIGGAENHGGSSLDLADNFIDLVQFTFSHFLIHLAYTVLGS